MSKQLEAEAAARDHTGRIGASRAAAVLGKDRWCTPAQAWLEIRGEAERGDEFNEPAHWGTVLEDAVGRHGYTRVTGRQLARVNRTLAHPKFPHITCHLDRRVINHRPGRIYQGKCRSAYKRNEWGEQGTDDVPFAEMIQVCVEVELAHLNFRGGAQFGDVGTLFGGNEFVWYEIERDPDLCGGIIEQLNEWHTIHIVEGREPEPMSEDDCRALWRKAHNEEREATPADEEWLRAFVIAEAEEKAAKKRKEAAAFEIRKLMGRTEAVTTEIRVEGKPPKRKALVAWPQKWTVDRDKLIEEQGVDEKYFVMDKDAIERLKTEDPEAFDAIRREHGSVDVKKHRKDNPKLWARYRLARDRGNMTVKPVARELYLADTEDTKEQQTDEQRELADANPF